MKKDNKTKNDLIILEKIDILRKQIDIEQRSILPALHNRFYHVAHNKIENIEFLSDQIYDLYNHLIYTGQNEIKETETFIKTL